MIPESLFIILAGIMGLLIGSFLNVVAIRLPEGRSIAFPASHCMKCGNTLRKIDLVPVLSYIWLRGKCHYCKTSVSPVYPLGELVTGALFAVYVWQIGWQLELIPALLFVCIMLVIVQTDLRLMIIPDRVVLFGLLTIVPIRLFVSHPFPLWNYAVAGLGVGILLFLLAVISKGGIGGGDIKLFALIGLFLGVQNTFLALFISSLLGVLVGAVIRLLRKDSKKKFIPFGPFIALGALFSYLWGEKAISWYWSLLTSGGS